MIVGTAGDCWDRFAIRFNEIRESVRIIRQVAKAMPDGDFRAQDKKVTPPPRNRIDESMEALIHHFKLFTEGFRVAPGDAYVPVESPRGELGCYIVSDGTSRPYRMHVRAPSFANLQAMAPMARGASSPTSSPAYPASTRYWGTSTVEPTFWELDWAEAGILGKDR